MSEPIHWTNDTRKLSELIPWEINPRQLTERQAEHLETSLRKFGEAIPLLISPDNEIYDGHQRKALMSIMQEYGHDAPIDVRVSSRPLTFEERKELVIRLHENTGEWDYDTLPNVYDVEELGEWGFPTWKLPGGEVNDPWVEWEGMPEYHNQDLAPKRTIKVHFANDTDLEEFARLLNLAITEKTISVWYPRRPEELTNQLGTGTQYES